MKFNTSTAKKYGLTLVGVLGSLFVFNSLANRSEPVAKVRDKVNSGI